MPKLTAAFIGYRDEWEMDRIRERVPDNVTVVGTPLQPSDTLKKRAFELAADADVVIP
jgi:hypothetical protein